MQKQKFDEIVSYFNKKVSEMEIETKYKMELLGMVTALGYAHEKETHDKRTETHACDLIDRRSAIDAVNQLAKWYYDTYHESAPATIGVIDKLMELPSVQPDLSEYSDKLWRSAYERGKRDAQTEIIRCKNCYWWTKQEDSLQGRCDRYGRYPTGAWFCASAKRREK